MVSGDRHWSDIDSWPDDDARRKQKNRITALREMFGLAAKNFKQEIEDYYNSLITGETKKRFKIKLREHKSDEKKNHKVFGGEIVYRWKRVISKYFEVHRHPVLIVELVLYCKYYKDFLYGAEIKVSSSGFSNSEAAKVFSMVDSDEGFVQVRRQIREFKLKEKE